MHCTGVYPLKGQIVRQELAERADTMPVHWDQGRYNLELQPKSLMTYSNSRSLPLCYRLRQGGMCRFIAIWWKGRMADRQSDRQVLMDFQSYLVKYRRSGPLNSFTEPPLCPLTTVPYPARLEVFEGGISLCIRIRSPPASHLLLLPTTLIIGIQKVHINTSRTPSNRDARPLI